MNGKPSIHLLEIQRTRGAGCALLLAKQCIAQRKADDKRAAGFHKVAPGTHLDTAFITREARWIAFKTRGYVPQRQRWPFMADRICDSLGCGVFDNSSDALMIMPL